MKKQFLKILSDKQLRKMRDAFIGAQLEVMMNEGLDELINDDDFRKFNTLYLKIHNELNNRINQNNKK